MKSPDEWWRAPRDPCCSADDEFRRLLSSEGICMRQKNSVDFVSFPSENTCVRVSRGALIMNFSRRGGDDETTG